MKKLYLLLMVSSLSIANASELSKFGRVAPTLVATRAPASILTTDPHGCGYTGGLVNCSASASDSPRFYRIIRPHE